MSGELSESVLLRAESEERVREAVSVLVRLRDVEIARAVLRVMVARGRPHAVEAAQAIAPDHDKRGKA